MPALLGPKSRVHPWRLRSPAVGGGVRAQSGRRADAYAELRVTTNFTFLTGASHPDEYVERAAELGYHALAVTDTNTLAGVVRAHIAAKEAGVELVVGCRLVFTDVADLSVLVYPTDLAAYGRLCRLLTLGKRRAEKGECRLELRDLLEHQEGLLAVAAPTPERGDEEEERPDLEAVLRELRDVFDDDRLSLAASFAYQQDDRQRLTRLAAVARRLGIPLVATNDAHYHAPERQPLQDVLTCIRRGCTLEEAGFDLFPNAERHLKPPHEMARLFAEHPHAIARTIEIADRARAFSLDELRYQYPDEVVPPGLTPTEHLAQLTWRGARERYPRGAPRKVREQIDHELRLIDELGYAHYFLTVHDIAAFARSRGILHQGRGAAANSAVCYCLGVTAVDPERIEVLFERFVSKERGEPPDIDIDFEHERREEVIQYLYAKYGRDRAALTAEVITYRRRSAVRDVGKALGLGLDTVNRLAKSLDAWGGGPLEPDQLRRLGLDPASPVVARLLALTDELLGFPRHLSQHVGGFVITQRPLCEIVPIENAAMPDRTVIEWDKDDIDAMGMLKVDVLGLGMLTCIRKCFELVRRHHGRDLTLANIPPEDPAVYDMICEADTIGVFQIESRAQMSMLPRLRPRCYYDLVIEVSIVRPGPIQGDMVHPYLRRRNGEEPVTYPDEMVRAVLGRTLGVPLFQEQAMSLAIRCAGFTPGEADRLRRAIAAWKRKQKTIDHFERKIIDGMTGRGYSEAFARGCFAQIKGFSEYGFPESHAASFALLVYVSSWLKHHYPAAFAAALLNSQPMGFYAPAQIVRDAQNHGVEVRPVDVNHSDWDCTLEEVVTSRPGAPGSWSGLPRIGGDIAHFEPNGQPASETAPSRSRLVKAVAKAALRLGLRRVKGVHEAEAAKLAAAVRTRGPFHSIEGLWRVSGVTVATLRRVAEADGFGSMGFDRQRALWHILKLREEDAPLFDAARDPRPAAAEPDDESAARLPAVPEYRRVTQDYAATGLSLKRHPIAFLRGWLDRRGAAPAADLRDEHRWPHGRWITLAGLCLVRQKPATASGTVFMTLEDETDSFNLIVRPRVYQAQRHAARTAAAMLVRGRVERQGRVIHINARTLEDITPRLRGLAVPSRDFH